MSFSLLNYILGPKTQGCMKGNQSECKKVQEQLDTVFLKPLYSINDTINDGIFGNGAGLLPVIPSNYKDKYVFCFYLMCEALL